MIAEILCVKHLDTRISIQNAVITILGTDYGKLKHFQFRGY